MLTGVIFESGPAEKEKPDKAITLFAYHSRLSETGWKTIFRIECPLSCEGLAPGIHSHSFTPNRKLN